ncbi:MAG: diaminopimelate decarboxylase [Myxococcota bacterium]
MFHFAYDEDGQLRAEEVLLETIAARVGTPCYVYSTATIERHYRVYEEALNGHPHLICYAMKANSCGAVLSLLAKKGAGADIVSEGELHRSLRAGVPADRIVFSGVGKTGGELEAALRAGILAFNVESEAELDELSAVALGLGSPAPVSLRVNPDVDPATHPYIATGLSESKFGVPITDGPRLARRVAEDPSLRLVGIDCHIGSQIVTLPPLMEALDSVLVLADELRASGHPVEHVDVGGGLGIPYEGEAPPHPSEFGAAVRARMSGRPEKVIVEPGRVIVGNAGILLSRVVHPKPTPSRRFLVIDAAMNDLLRPALYQAFHDIWPVRRSEAARDPYDVVGPVCESGDTFAKGRALPPLVRGDLVALMSAGAYGFVMSSAYNSRPRPAEVLVSGDRFAVVRDRESIEDLIRGERLPPWWDDSEEQR